jgi:hypothetical protein
MTGTELIAAERERQQSEERWTPKHDDQHVNGAMVEAAIRYAFESRRRGLKASAAKEFLRHPWPWDDFYWKPSPGIGQTIEDADAVRMLVKAGALIAAEIDRIQRQTPPATAGKE